LRVARVRVACRSMAMKVRTSVKKICEHCKVVASQRRDPRDLQAQSAAQAASKVAEGGVSCTNCRR